MTADLLDSLPAVVEILFGDLTQTVGQCTVFGAPLVEFVLGTGLRPHTKPPGPNMTGLKLRLRLFQISAALRTRPLHHTSRHVLQFHWVECGADLMIRVRAATASGQRGTMEVKDGSQAPKDQIMPMRESRVNCM